MEADVAVRDVGGSEQRSSPCLATLFVTGAFSRAYVASIDDAGT